MLDETKAGRTSALAFLSLVCGVAAGIVAWCSFSAIQLMRWSEIFFEPTRMSYEIGNVVALILAIVTVAPAVGAGIFWLAARAAIRDSNGTVRGVALYRTGLVVAILSLLVAVAGDASVVGAAERGRREAKALPESSIQSGARSWYLYYEARRILQFRVDGGSYRPSYGQQPGENLEERREFAQMVLPLKGEGEDYVYLRHARSMTVQEARTKLQGLGRLDEVLQRSDLRPDDHIVIAPLKPVEGIDPEALVRTFFVGVEGEREYVYYFFRETEHEGSRWINLDPIRVQTTGNRPRFACRQPVCAFESDRRDVCSKHGVSYVELWYVCERDWIRSTAPGDCSECRGPLRRCVRE